MAGARLQGAVLAILASTSLGCNAWRCDFQSHGACIEFTTPPQDLDAARARVDALLDRELPFWGLHSLGDWRIEFRDSADRQCYLAAQSEGCTDYVDKTISVRVPPTSQGCFEAAELLHELGHYALGDPRHSNDLWENVSPAFAEMVWNFQGAPPECVQRYGGVTTGMWSVMMDHF